MSGRVEDSYRERDVHGDQLHPATRHLLPKLRTRRIRAASEVLARLSPTGFPYRLFSQKDSLPIVLMFHLNGEKPGMPLSSGCTPKAPVLHTTRSNISYPP